MFQSIKEIAEKELPGGITEEEIEKEYGRDIEWERMKKDRKWMEFLALCILDKRNGTKEARNYQG